MRRLGSVQNKVACVFVTDVKEESSRKRAGQQFQVVATEDLNPAALEANVDSALATEKLDGTCCYVTLYKGRPHLWARLDRKPNKQAEKKFRKHQRSHHSSKGFLWNVDEDFKAVPQTWIPAHGVQILNGHAVPDQHGHIPGWVPVDSDNKQYCWHSSVLDSDSGSALVLRPTANDEDLLEVAEVPLDELLEHTLELIGTNVNANPYGLGSKKQPLHCLVSHGSIRIRNPPPVHFQALSSWLQESPDGRVEGIVWHCNDGTLLKVHRHHLGVPWPEAERGTSLGDRSVVIQVKRTLDEYNNNKDLFSLFSSLHGHCFTRLLHLHFDS